MASRTYVVDVPGGTNTSSVQIIAKGTIRRIIFNMVNAATGKTEVSTAAAPQIGTVQPTANVQARINHSATAGQNNQEFDVVLPVTAFQLIYIHQTGAGNIGTVSLITS